MWEVVWEVQLLAEFEMRHVFVFSRGSMVEKLRLRERLCERLRERLWERFNFWLRLTWDIALFFSRGSMVEKLRLCERLHERFRERLRRSLLCCWGRGFAAAEEEAPLEEAQSRSSTHDDYRCWRCFLSCFDSGQSWLSTHDVDRQLSSSTSLPYLLWNATKPSS